MFSDIDELLGDMKKIVWTVHGWLETDSLGMLYGPSGSGKSFVAIDIACCVATGTPFLGANIRRGSVFYIAGEGHNGFARRAAAWQRIKGVSLKGAPLFKSNKAILLLDREAAAGLSAEVDRLVALRGVQPELVTIDTMARNFGDGDENSNQDAGRFIEHIDEFIRRKYKCHVLIVHHSGHGMDRERRGERVPRRGRPEAVGLPEGRRHGARGGQDEGGRGAGASHAAPEAGRGR